MWVSHRWLKEDRGKGLVLSVACVLFDTSTGIRYSYGKTFTTEPVMTSFSASYGEEELFHMVDQNADSFAKELARAMKLDRDCGIVDRIAAELLIDTVNREEKSYYEQN